MTKRTIAPESQYRIALRCADLLKDPKIPDRDKEIAREFAIYQRGAYEIAGLQKITGKRGFLSEDMISIEIRRLFGDLIEYQPRYPNQKHRHTADERRLLRKAKERLMKANPFCAICGSPEGLALDHIVPVTAGGGNDNGNLQLLCAVCHRKKTIQEGEALGFLKSQRRNKP